MNGSLLLALACLASGAAGVALGIFARASWTRAAVRTDVRAGAGKGAYPPPMGEIGERPAPGNSSAPDSGSTLVTYAARLALQQAVDPAAPLELSDEELDAMPPDLPAPTLRSRRSLAAPAKPAFRRL